MVSTPVGTVMMWAGGSDSSTILNLAYAGWALCDGASYSNDTQFHDLYEVIGESYGGGNGMFCVPSYKGLFLRGTSYTSERDPDAESRGAPRPDQSNRGNTGNAVGSVQPYSMQSHTHTYKYHNSYTKSTHTAGNHCLSGSTTTNMGNSGSLETRPVNQYVNFIIKATTSADTILPGSVLPFAGNEAEANALANAEGWLLCNGKKLATSDYPSLLQVISSYYGSETGYYYLPDYRGRFLRGVQGSAIPGLPVDDPDAANRTAPQPSLSHKGNASNLVGSVQATAYSAHAHSYTYNNDYWSTAGTLIGSTQQANDKEGATSDSTGGKESRPININTNFIIKCK